MELEASGREQLETHRDDPVHAWLIDVLEARCRESAGTHSTPRDLPAALAARLDAFDRVTVITEHPSSNRQIPPPATLDPKPWKVGQWALYESRLDGEIAVQRISVVAQDSCGIWIESDGYSSRAHFKWRMCLRPGEAKTSALDLLQKFEVQNGRDTVPTTIDFRNEDARSKRDLAGFVEALLPTRIAVDANLVRGDVEVPAGHFAQVIRETQKLDDGGQATRWFSPEVPFDGTIKRQTSGYEWLLLAYEFGAAPYEAAAPASGHDAAPQ